MVTGAGVEGRRKKKRDRSPTPPPEEPAGDEPVLEGEEEGTKKRGRPQFGDAGDADIFFTRK